MTNRLILLVLVVSMNCFGQEAKTDKEMSIGVYGIGYPLFDYTIIHSGALLDYSLQNKKRLASSSSLNYSGYYRFGYENHNFSIASGLSWKLQKKRLAFRPGIQLGYFYQNRFALEYTYHSVLTRLSAELTYVVNRFEFGFHANIGISYGKVAVDREWENHYSYNGMTGFGVVLKYSVFR